MCYFPSAFSLIYLFPRADLLSHCLQSTELSIKVCQHCLPAEPQNHQRPEHYSFIHLKIYKLIH